MIKKLSIATFALIISSCATTNALPPQGLKVATEKDISNCQLVGDVHGTSMLYGVFVESALSKARQQAFNQAKDMGANTIVWQPFQTQSGATSVHGNAYLCK